MSTQTRARQRDPRYAVLRPDKAFIEFSHGRRDWRLTLINVSIGGISFCIDDGVPGLSTGSRLESVLHVGDCEIHGVVIVRHATEHTDMTTHYGGMLYPAEEGDLMKLNGVLAGIDTITTR